MSAKSSKLKAISSEGQSLLEAILAIGLLLIVISGAFTLLRSQFANVDAARGTMSTLDSAEEGLEAARSIRDQNWTLLSPGTHGLIQSSGVWSFQGTSDTTSSITRSVVVTDLATNERQVTVTVTSTSNYFPPRMTTLTTKFTNWRSITAPANELSGNWGNPKTLGSIDLGPGVQGNALAVRSKMVYMAGSASNVNKNDFFIIDATSGTNPIVMAKIDTGPGLNDMSVSGTYAYVANQSGTGQLQIIDVSNLSSPSLVKTFGLTNNAALGQSVAATSTFVLVGTKNNDAGPELYVVSVTSTSNPQILSSIEIGGDVNGIAIYNNYAFLATSNDNQEFTVVDLSQPTNARQVTALDLGGGEDAYGIYINTHDIRAYVARQSGTSPHPQLAMIDISSPLNPTLLYSMTYSNDVNSVLAADDLVFLGTTNANQEFNIYQTTSTPIGLNFYSGMNFPQVANDIALENNYLYIAVRSNDALRILTSQ